MKCLILDDEPYAHQVLEHYIKQTPGLVLVAGFRNSLDAYEYLTNNHVDLLFLDIEMPLITGVAFLKALKKKPQTIFTTAYKEYAFEGFELGVIDFLLKPFSYERFIQAIEKINPLSNINRETVDTLAIRDGDGLKNINQSDIFYVEGLKDYIKIVTFSREYIIYHTLKGILIKLNRSYFLQCHRSFIINKSQVTRISSNNILLKDQTYIPIGTSFKKEFIKTIQNIEG